MYQYQVNITNNLLDHHLQNLQYLTLLRQRHRIRLTPPIMQTILSQLIQLIPTNPNILQRPRHPQLPNHHIQNIPQIHLRGIQPSPL